MRARRHHFRSRSPAHSGVTVGGAPGGKYRSVVYARNTSLVVQRTSRQALALLEWMDDSRILLGTGWTDCEVADWQNTSGSNPLPKEVWQEVLNALDTAAQGAASTAAVSDLLLQTGREMALDALDTQILQLLIDYETCRPVEQLWDRMCDAGGEATCLRLDAHLIAMMLGKGEEDVAARLVATSALRLSGLLRVVPNFGVSVLPRLSFMARQPAGKTEDIRSALLGPKQTSSLALSDFEHLGADIDHMLALLRGALETRTKGIVVVLYGPPGTGKTELAKSIAEALGTPLHAVGEMDESGCEPTREERLGELQMAQRLLANAEPAILLFDEAEDLFGEANDLFSFLGSRRSHGSKAFMHRLIENGTAPMIWTTNSLAGFGPAMLRRMSACLELQVPPVAVRKRIWEQASAAEGVATDGAELGRLSRQLPAAPALARSAMRAARLAGGDPQTVRWALNGVCRAMNGGHSLPAAGQDADFDLNLVNADVDLVVLASRLAAPDAPRNVSLLLSGPSGSGKSAYARHLAERMGLEVVQKRGSDLLGKYVGETEKRIAGAFTEAAATGSFLIFDEADSLLGDRSGATRNWEVSQVNEMLTWMEMHPLPFCCTTNFVDRLDKAAMRRFLFKAGFRPLNPSQRAVAFERIFGLEPPSGLARLEQLTPADFTLVRKVAGIQGILSDSESLLAALEREQIARHGNAFHIGFGA